MDGYCVCVLFPDNSQDQLLRECDNDIPTMAEKLTALVDSYIKVNTILLNNYLHLILVVWVHFHIFFRYFP